MARSVSLEQAINTTTGSLTIESTLGRFNSLSRLWVFCDTPEFVRLVADAPGVHVEMSVAGSHMELLRQMIDEAIEHRIALDAEATRQAEEKAAAARAPAGGGVMSQPIQPSVRRMFAQFLATSDPRCGFEEHNKVAQGEMCIRCRRDLLTYLEVVPAEWPV